MYGIALVVVIAAMGGVIAYIGDKLGTKVGKKKLSVFGLRPKHTSILVTIVTGIIIAATTLGAMNAVSKDVRTALFGMEELKSQLVFLNKEVNDKTHELGLSQAELKSQGEEYAALTQKTASTLTRLNSITGELNSLQGRYDLAKNEIGSLTMTKNELDAKIKDLGNERESLQTDIGLLKTLAENLHQGIQNMRAGTVVLRAGEVLSTIVLAAGQDAKTADDNLKLMIYQTNMALLERFGVKDKNMEILWINQIDFDRAVTNLAGSKQDTVVRISTLGNTIYGEPIIGYIDLFPNNLIYQKDSTVYTEIFPMPANDQQAEEMILSFLHKVNTEAIGKGVLPDPISGTVGSMSGAKLFEAINKVKGHIKETSREKIEVTAVAAQNISAVGPLFVDIRIR